jgi:hypothetical protein
MKGLIQSGGERGYGTVLDQLKRSTLKVLKRILSKESINLNTSNSPDERGRSTEVNASSK